MDVTRMTKTEAKKIIKEEILPKYKNFQNISPEHFDFMMKILLNHQDAMEKIGCGVKNIFVAPSGMYGGHNFWIRRVDDTVIDFSYLKCFAKTTLKDDYLKACRLAIDPAIIAFRDKAFNGAETVICPIENRPITREESHVDHDEPLPFIILAKMFFEKEKLELEKIGFTNGVGTRFKDAELEKRWFCFHNRYARLRVISAKANQALLKKKW